MSQKSNLGSYAYRAMTYGQLVGKVEAPFKITGGNLKFKGLKFENFEKSFIVEGAGNIEFEDIDSDSDVFVEAKDAGDLTFIQIDHHPLSYD